MKHLAYSMGFYSGPIGLPFNHTMSDCFKLRSSLRIDIIIALSTSSDPLVVQQINAFLCPFRRGARVAERGGLENRYTRKGIEGSNPSLSANPIKTLAIIAWAKAPVG